jgi:hypothetical protein
LSSRTGQPIDQLQQRKAIAIVAIATVINNSNSNSSNSSIKPTTHFSKQQITRHINFRERKNVELAAAAVARALCQG